MAAPTQHEGQREGNRLDRLLAFLNSNQSEQGMTPEEIREHRGRRYEEIRRKQVRMFAWRGSPTPDLLADRTFDRVMEILTSGGLDDYEGDPAHYVLGVGRKILMESWRQVATPEIPPRPEKSEEHERALDCLDRCMEELLPPWERELILEYYQGEKRAKIEHRREIAERHNLTVNALRIECCRIRGRLRECVRGCVEERK